MNRNRIVGIISKKSDLSLIEIFKKELHESLSKKGFFYFETLCQENIFLAEIFLENQCNQDSKINNEKFSVLDGEFHYKHDLTSHIKNNSKSEKKFLIDSYDVHEEQIFTKLAGNFSFALYDDSKKKLFLARDHFGVKPLFYFEDENCLIFSSEIKFINFFSKIKLTISEKKMVQFLCQYLESTEETFYEEIKTLLPSHYLVYENNNAELKRYDHFSETQLNYKDFKLAAQTLKKVLTNAVEERLVHNKVKKIGCLVSGGLDSTSIYSLMKESSSSYTYPMTMNFYDKKRNPLKCDEEFFQNKIIEDKFKRIRIDFVEQSPLEKISEFLNRHDQPFELANSYLWDETYKIAKSENIKIIFNGIDGDIVISHGYERLKELFKLRSIHIFFRELYLFSLVHRRESSKRPIWLVILKILLKENLLFFYFIKLKKLFSKKKMSRHIIKKKYIEDFNVKEVFSQIRMFRPHREKIDNNIISAGLVSLDLLSFEKNIFNQFPFFDIKVVNFCKSLKSEFKLKDGKTRHILREAMREVIPEDIANRYTKANLTYNYMDSITSKDFKNIEFEINNIHPKLKRFIDKDNLIAEFNTFLSGTMSNQVSTNIWTFFLCNKWLKSIAQD